MNSIFASQLPHNMQPFGLTSTQEKAIDHFSGVLEQCKSQLATGMPVMLAGNIQTCFGSDLAGEFFAYQLGLELGHSIYICNGDDGLCTFVCFASDTDNPSNLPPSLGHPSLANLDHKPAESTDAESTDHAAAPIRKNPPRPMNCWLLYRDSVHKEIKDQNPHLSVQEICKHFPRQQCLTGTLLSLESNLIFDSWSMLSEVEEPSRRQERGVARTCKGSKRGAPAHVPGLQIQPSQARPKEEAPVSEVYAGGCEGDCSGSSSYQCHGRPHSNG